MYIDTNALPEEFEPSEWIEKFKQLQRINITDPTKTINTIPDTTTTGQGLWSQIQGKGNTFAPLSDPLDDRLSILEKEIKLMRQDNKLMRLKILALENKFSAEEIINIRKMILSEDEAAQILAETIINNA